MLDAARATPAEALIAALPPDRPFLPRLTRLQRANLSLLILVSQLVQSVFVGVLVAGFLVAVGLIAIPVTVQERWIGDAVRAAATVNGPVGTFLLTSELLIVSGMLGAIVGLYFTGLSLTDAAFRRDYFARVIAEVERIAAVRAVYVAAIRTPIVDPAVDGI
jgi:hypothetical protein